MQTNLFSAIPQAWQKPVFSVTAGTLADKDLRGELLDDVFQQIEQGLDEFRDDCLLADNSDHLKDYGILVDEMSFQVQCGYGFDIWRSLEFLVADELDIDSEVPRAANFVDREAAIKAMLEFMDESLISSSICEVSAQYQYDAIPDWTIATLQLGDVYIGRVDWLIDSYPALEGIDADEVAEMIEDKTFYHCSHGEIYQDCHDTVAIFTLGEHEIETLCKWLIDRIQQP